MRRLGSPAGSARILIAILAAAFNLRIGIVAIGPVIDEVRADTSMSSGVAGVLTTIPFLCMGTFAFLGPPLAQRVGAARVVIGALALIAVGSAARSAVAEAWAVLAATLPIGLGIALIGGHPAGGGQGAMRWCNLNLNRVRRPLIGFDAAAPD
ncbi:MAG: hypothetical protein GEU88_00890 [Solirubrobacterales bacterium]|nr:hypothetical protein [Solirubrobacterales bacterium]